VVFAAEAPTPEIMAGSRSFAYSLFTNPEPAGFPGGADVLSLRGFSGVLVVVRGHNRNLCVFPV
jgi:hypothetical protein